MRSFSSCCESLQAGTNPEAMRTGTYVSPEHLRQLLVHFCRPWLQPCGRHQASGAAHWHFRLTWASHLHTTAGLDACSKSGRHAQEAVHNAGARRFNRLWPPILMLWIAHEDPRPLP